MVQGQALEIEARAKMRIADEYDAANAAGETAGAGYRSDLVGDDDEVKPTTQDLGLHREDIRQARKARDTYFNDDLQEETAA